MYLTNSGNISRVSFMLKSPSYLTCTHEHVLSCSFLDCNTSMDTPAVTTYCCQAVIGEWLFGGGVSCVSPQTVPGSHWAGPVPPPGGGCLRCQSRTAAPRQPLG